MALGTLSSLMWKGLSELLKGEKGVHRGLGKKMSFKRRMTMMMTTKGRNLRGLVLSLKELGGLTKIWNLVMKNLWKKI